MIEKSSISETVKNLDVNTFDGVVTIMKVEIPSVIAYSMAKGFTDTKQKKRTLSVRWERNVTMTMTDREKLIELIKVGRGCPDDGSPFDEVRCQHCRYADDVDCDITRLADHLISNGITVQKWIPVSEPPKEYRDEYGELIPFLVCEKTTEYPFRGLYDGKTWGDGLISIYPTHWMPLPEPPKECE